MNTINAKPKTNNNKKTGRSPIYNHANATMQGLTTIRAFRAQDILCHEFNTFQNFNSSAWYLYYALANSFAFCLEMTCLFYLTTVLLSFLLYSESGEPHQPATLAKIWNEGDHCFTNGICNNNGNTCLCSVQCTQSI